jgi:hypothetical protein
MSVCVLWTFWLVIKEDEDQEDEEGGLKAESSIAR